MGELPRSMQLVVDRTLVGTIAPGTRVTAVGIYSIYQARCCISRPRCPQGPSGPQAAWDDCRCMGHVRGVLSKHAAPPGTTEAPQDLPGTT